MTIANYSELQAEVIAWSERSDQTAKAPLWIKLAESKLNRALGAVETESTITSVLSSRLIDITSLSVERPIGLFLAETGINEREINFKANGTYPQSVTSGRPAWVSRVAENLEFDRPFDGVYPLRFVYRQKFALSDSAPTNWLLTNHPDVYLAATMMWGMGYNEGWENGSVWKSVLDEAIPSIKSAIAASKRGLSTVDPALRAIGRPTYNELVNGQY